MVENEMGQNEGEEPDPIGRNRARELPDLQPSTHFSDSQLRPLVQPEGGVQERHETDREMDGVVQTKVFTMKFNDFRDIPMDIWRRIVKKG